MKDFLRRLVERHPDRAPQIVGLAGADAGFRSLCEEIVLAEDALERWKWMPERAQEYREILKDRMDEFWVRLSDCMTPPAG
jgi:hypothetical protein